MNPHSPASPSAPALSASSRANRPTGKRRVRNDRLLAVAEMNHEYAYIKRLGDLPKKFLRELEEFFVNYHRLEGKEYTLLGCKKVDAAMRMIHKAQRAA